MQFNKEDIDIGERLRTVRENMHMTREQFSEKIDITAIVCNESIDTFELIINYKIYIRQGDNPPAFFM